MGNYYYYNPQYILKRAYYDDQGRREICIRNSLLISNKERPRTLGLSTHTGRHGWADVFVALVRIPTSNGMAGTKEEMWEFIECPPSHWNQNLH